MPRKPAPYITDLSHHQPNVDLAAMKADGCAGVILKATEGTKVTDSTFRKRLAAADALGLPATAYHFARPAAGPPRDQADRLTTATGFRSVVLDLEDSGNLSPHALTTWALAFLDQCRHNTGCTPILYTGYYFARDGLDGRPDLADYPLWLARYTKATTTPAPEPWTAWTLWQFTDAAQTPGVGPCDRSRIAKGVNVADLFGLNRTQPPPATDDGYTLTVPGARILRPGHRGQDVKNLQGLLRARGYLVECDGIFGNATAQIVAHVQTLAGLEPVSGVAGPKTMGWLLGDQG